MTKIKTLYISHCQTKIKATMSRAKLKNAITSFTFGLIGGLIAVAIAFTVNRPNNQLYNTSAPDNGSTATSGANSIITPTKGNNLVTNCNLDFTEAAEKARKAVVHIRTEYYTEPDVMNFFFGGNMQLPPIKGSGSGVIISSDGYIVTNNHVIENAVNITVTLFDRRTFKAKVIGRDPATDIALIKIDTDSLPVLPFGDSDKLKVGEWVLAIGNPFNLTSTVTAGIVSAKGRSVSIMDKRYAIESFIQTDAAINPGNSGGALVNLDGELVGINTAIASPTGVYAGYGFAVPVSIVKKVVADLLEYGSVQRAFLGVNVSDITQEFAQKYHLNTYQGVVVVNVIDNGAAAEAGIKEGDVITAVNGVKVTDVPELLEKIGQHRPGDNVTLTIIRNGKKLDIPVVLRNSQGKTTIEIKERVDLLGATFEDLSDEEKADLGIKYGVRVVDLGPGKLRAVGVRPGFIIVKINDKPIKSVDELKKVINNLRGGVYIQGIYPDGTVAYYAFGLR